MSGKPFFLVDYDNRHLRLNSKGSADPKAYRHTEAISSRKADDDSKSFSSNMKELSVQNGRLTTSNKRSAVESAQGQDPEMGGRPLKLRPGSYNDSFCSVPAERKVRISLYDVTRDQMSSNSAESVHEFSPDPVRSPQETAGQILPDRVPRLFNESPWGPQISHAPPFSPEPTAPTSPAFTSNSGGEPLFLQPETRPITLEQLVNEVKGIYAGLVMVEKKIVEVDRQQSNTTNQLSNEQWQALIALHRTLLHEHHDFFLASQHPSSSLALHRLATKYATPARMWRHGINSFLELLRHRLPDSLDHVLAFVYLAYSMMASLMESVPSFEVTWIECLGDLARYRMAIEEADLRDREVWSGVARMWYNKAADKSPNVGRIQHHLAVLARPNIVQQLFDYLKALASVVPFPNARESITLFFHSFLEASELASGRYPFVEPDLIKTHGVQFTPDAASACALLMDQLCSIWDTYVGRVATKSSLPHPEIGYSLFPAVLDFEIAKTSPLPNDCVLRGSVWAEYYFPPDFFESCVIDEEVRDLELPTHASGRTERCLWHGVRLASLNLWQVGCRITFGSIYKYVGSCLFQRLKKLTSCKKHFSFCPTLLASLLVPRHAYAAPIGPRPVADDTASPANWFNWSIICQILGWPTAISVASGVTYVGVSGRPRDLTHYGVLSVGTCVASFVFLDAGASAEVKWPTFVVGCIFLVNFGRKIVKHHALDLGWLPVILGVSLVLDAFLVNISNGTQGSNQGLFAPLLPTCLSLSLSAFSCMAYIVKCMNHQGVSGDV